MRLNHFFGLFNFLVPLSKSTSQQSGGNILSSDKIDVSWPSLRGPTLNPFRMKPSRPKDRNRNPFLSLDKTLEWENRRNRLGKNKNDLNFYPSRNS